MQKWEYKSAYVFTNVDEKTRVQWGNSDDLPVDQIPDLFNKMGKEGWELVCVDHHIGSDLGKRSEGGIGTIFLKSVGTISTTYWFKRQAG